MHVFTYGSLMFPEVWSRVVSGSYRALPVHAKHYARFAVRDETYPGAVAQAGAVLHGMLYCDVDTADLKVLDRFEGADYRRVEIEVLAADGQTCKAQIYLYLQIAQLSDSDWKPEEFRLSEFLVTYCGLVPQ